jgi:acetolactate synthase-1/3 small subunit
VFELTGSTEEIDRFIRLLSVIGLVVVEGAGGHGLLIATDDAS